MDFYQKCWLILKSQRPRLRKQMDEIEIQVAELPLHLNSGQVRPKLQRADKESANDEEELGEVV